MNDLDTQIDKLPSVLRHDAEPGFALFPEFSAPTVGEAMLADVVSIARMSANGTSVAPTIVMPENQPMPGNNPEDVVSKIFSLHRRPAFQRFTNDERVQSIVRSAIGDDVDCFLSQFIFKNPGARGQPWHQDSYYFPFSPHGPVVGLWLAVTEATLANGCLKVLPSSQCEPIHDHIPDRREGANNGYVEIIDHDMSESQPCLMERGDLLIFDSHLMHRSTDNLSTGLRAAMVWHFAQAGTVDRGIKNKAGNWVPNPINDWVPYLRNGMLAS